jgi:hypothetical protein
MSNDEMKNSGMPHSSTDDLINDYLSDMFGGEPVPAIEPETSESGAIESSVVESSIFEPSVVESRVVEPGVVEPGVVEPGVVESSTVEPDPFVTESVESLDAIQMQELSSGLDSLKGESAVALEPLAPPATVKEDSYIEGMSSSNAVIDVFGGHRVSTIEAISSDMSLIPTIKLIKDVEDTSVRSQCEAQIILLTFLFYLRKPLSPRVRKSFLDYSEQAIDDYYAAFWLKESAAERLQ